jgi:hypothetical protein
LNSRFTKRLVIFLLCAVPALTNGQINRSATELARENIHEYLTDKLFKSHPYQPISYGQLKAVDKKSRDVKWSIVHKFEITETLREADKKIEVQKPYDFIFYLDDKMRVLGARSYSE